MDMNVIITAIGSIGFPSAIAVYLLWKRDKDKREFMDTLDKKDRENREFTNDRINEMKVELKEVKEENKEDKKMFKDALDTFQKSVIESKTIGNDISYIKTEMKDIKADIESIKSKV